MKQPRTLTTRLALLALLLAFGPLQATATFACEMMETVVHEDCCCDEAAAVRNAAGSETDCDDSDMSSMASEPCCEHVATVGIDAEVFKAIALTKSSGKSPATQSDIDPPHACIVDGQAGFSLPELPPVAATPGFTERSSGDGSALWLTTGRLRI